MDYKKIYAIKMQNEKRIKELCPDATHKSGIYCFHREDENGFKYAYVGLATKSVLSRCAEHLSGYTQHIDRSLKAHKLYDKENPYGWKLSVMLYCSADECNEKEQEYIKKAHDSGFQLLNVTRGSQGIGKTDIGERKPAKKYFDGVEQGKKNTRKFIAALFEKHLDYVPKKNPPTKLQEKAMQKFKAFLEGENG